MAQWNTERILAIGKDALYNDNEYVLSIQYFNQAIKIKPYLPESYILRSVAKINLGDYFGAEEDCNKSLEINPFVPYAYFIRGFSRANQNELYEALQDLNKALKFQPNDTAYLSYRLAIKEVAKDYKAAIEDVDILYKLQPKRHQLLYYKGNYLLELKDTANAILLFEKLNKLDERCSLGWSALGFIYMQKKSNDAALEYFNQSIIRKSTYSGDYINRGYFNKNKNNLKQALLDYNNAIKYDSSEVLGYYNRGMLLEYLGDSNRALKDLEKTVELDSTNYDARLNKAILELTLTHNYKQAIIDYMLILEKYPYFIPALSGIAEAEESLENYQMASFYKQKIKNINKNTNYFKQKAKESIVASNKISKNIKENGLVIRKNKNKLFNEFDPNLIDSTSISITGKIQNRNVNVINERNFSINSIVINRLPRSTNLSRAEIDEINRLKIVQVYFCLSNNDIPLLSDIISIHFTAIKTITDSLSNSNNQTEKYLARGVEFDLVKDYIGALNDFDKVIQISPDYVLGYFSRANIRLKLFETQCERNGTSSDNIKIKEQQLLNPEIKEFKDDSITYQMIINDYDKVIELNPDFTFAYFNKANILCSQKDFKLAISNYSKAISIDSEFAEAYFNRGLTYLFIGEDAKGLADLSKAGELGVYKAYNLIQRFKK